MVGTDFLIPKGEVRGKSLSGALCSVSVLTSQCARGDRQRKKRAELFQTNPVRESYFPKHGHGTDGNSVNI